MSGFAEEFVTPDKENHSRVKGAVETAMTADFKVEVAPKHDPAAGFSKKPLEFFVREKIDPASFVKSQPGPSPTTAAPDANHTVPPSAVESPTVAEPITADTTRQEGGLDDLAQVLLEDNVQSGETEPQLDTAESLTDLEDLADKQQSDHYDEGFSAGRAAVLSELEEQRLEHLEVLKSISEKLLTDSVFDFDNISKKVLETVNELASERCGLAIDDNPEVFLKRIDAKIEQLRSLSEERSVFFNEEDLEALKSFDEFNNYFAKAQVRSDPTLRRGEIIVKVGGVELRDAPFQDSEKEPQYE